MLRNPNRSPRSTIPATGLGSILVAVPRLALAADRDVVAALAVAVGTGEGGSCATSRRPGVDVGADREGMSAGAPGIDRLVSEPTLDGVAADPTTTTSGGIR